METVQYQKILLIVLLSVWSIGNIFANLNVYFGEPDDKDRLYTGISTLGLLFVAWAIHVIKNW